MQSRPSLILCWQALFDALGVAREQSDRAIDPWLALHEEDHRRYHTLEHIFATTRVAATLSALYAPAQSSSILLACLFHDSVYDPRAHDNEEQSALRAEAMLHGLGLDETLIARVVELILITRTHQPNDDLAAAVLCDADLSILGSDASTYDAYTRAIREEYGHVPEDAYRPSRIAVLEKFLMRPAIYRTPMMAAESEDRARENIEREIKNPPRLPEREELRYIYEADP